MWCRQCLQRGNKCVCFPPINLNELAKKITLIEGKKISLSIAQVKEVLKITLAELRELGLLKT